MRREHMHWVACVVALLSTGGAHGADIELKWGDATFGLTGVLTTGAALRTEGRNYALIGKTDVPGQQTLCAADDCMSLTGNPEPNQRLIDAVGAYTGVNTDNGDMNYDKYSVVAATTKLTPTFTFADGPITAKVRGILFYDPVNTNFQETHNNTLYQPAKTKRSADIERRFALGFRLREAYLNAGNDLYSVTLGNQIVNWGESLLTAFNTVNAINPYDGSVVRMPGAQVNEFFQAVPALRVNGDLGSGVSAELVYQLAFVPVITDASGSFFSSANVLGGGNYIVLGLGQFSQDPNRQYRPPGVPSLISSASRTAYVLADHFGEAQDNGQFGLKLQYFAPDFNDGTQFGLYYLHYHSRVPYLSAFAANASCTRDAAIPGSFVAALVACRGFNGALKPIGREPLPGDTLRPFRDYPENINMVGVSFNTNVGSWSLAGEYAYRPDMPVQISLSDVIFAAGAPAFPSQDIPVPVNILGNSAPFTIPGNRTSVPDFLSVYRGITIQPNQFIRGYERLGTGQFALTGIRQYGPSENPFGADSLQIVVELSGENVFGLPGLDQLQFEGAGDRTHHSAGADGTGDPSGRPNSLRVNPTQQNKGFATSWSWGYRVLARLTYSQVFAGINFSPTVLLFHDLGGISPANTPNYISGRKTINALLDADLSQSLKVILRYQKFTGGGLYNVLSDRDNLSLSIAYSF